jgi:argininosuccinate lyase
MLWQKDTGAEDWVTRFTVGDDYQWDTVLLPYDIRATRAHAWGLRQIEILDAGELDEINNALDELHDGVTAGEIAVTPADEDCHTVIEQYLTNELGAIGKKIHAGRSRNDQVLAAVRLFLREQIVTIARRVIDLSELLCELGAANDDRLMPGYTHLQQAMPSTPGAWAAGFAETLLADLETLRSAYRAINVSPLGSAAGYGVPHLDLPRQPVAERLGFRDIQTHVTAVQLSRGKLEQEVVHAFVQVAGTINRMAADLVLYNTKEFAFVELPDEYCTGSSIMPQKKNPDVLELARAQYHRLTGNLQQLLGLPANLPSGYHRDLQLVKAAAMESGFITEDLLTAMNHLIPGVRFRPDKMREACSPGLLATAEAIEAVREGVPFREAYRQAARRIEELELPPTDTILSTYASPGEPGHIDTDLIDHRLDEYRTWIDHR